VKITKKNLEKLINEEINKVLSEWDDGYNSWDAYKSGLGAGWDAYWRGDDWYDAFVTTAGREELKHILNRMKRLNQTRKARLRVKKKQKPFTAAQFSRTMIGHFQKAIKALEKLPPDGEDIETASDEDMAAYEEAISHAEKAYDFYMTQGNKHRRTAEWKKFDDNVETISGAPAGQIEVMYKGIHGFRQDTLDSHIKKLDDAIMYFYKYL